MPFSFFTIREPYKPYYEEKTINFKEELEMLEMAVFALVFVVAQVIVGVIMTKYMMAKYMNKEFIKNYTKMGIEVANELMEEMENKKSGGA